MIRIHRPPEAPAILADKGKRKQRALCSGYSRSPKAYKTGAKTFSFDSSVYAHRSVKEALVAMQSGKCCFCESKITHTAYGDVEHFRPKAGFRQTPTDLLTTPGYYWLAYEWGNLLLCCQLCNQQFKANLFPLRDPAKRARCHRHDIAQERPLLVNPAEQDPQEFISFRAEMPYAIGDNIEGRTTIHALGLDREALNERREERLSGLRALYRVANMDPPLPQSCEARAELMRAVAGTAEYAAMSRAAVASGFSYASAL
jgi:uncharacterized protein (TIGR02646 family)